MQLNADTCNDWARKVEWKLKAHHNAMQIEIETNKRMFNIEWRRRQQASHENPVKPLSEGEEELPEVPEEKYECCKSSDRLQRLQSSCDM